MIRKENISGSTKIIVGDKYNDLVLKTLGRIYVQTGSKFTLLSDFFKQLNDTTKDNIKIIDNLKDIDYPGDKFFIYEKLNKNLYFTYNNEYIPLISNNNEDLNWETIKQAFVSKEGDVINGELTITGSLNSRNANLENIKTINPIIINSNKAPFIINSNNLVKNLNSEFLDGNSSNDFAIKNKSEEISGNWKFENEIYFNNSLTSKSGFASGFSGYGWKLDGDTNTLTIDNLIVRKIMNVYELVVNKINCTNGALWVSDSAKISKCYHLNTNSEYWNKLYSDNFYHNAIILVYNKELDKNEEINIVNKYFKFNSDNTENLNYYLIELDSDYIPFRENDLIRCQAFKNNNIKYYDGLVTNTLGNRMIILISNLNNDIYSNLENNNLINLPNSQYEVDKNNNIVRYKPDGSVYDPVIDIDVDLDTLSVKEISSIALDRYLVQPTEGDSIVRIGNTYLDDRQGAIYMTSNDTHSPYIDILDNVSIPDYNSLKPFKKDNQIIYSKNLKVRLGNLNGIYDPDFQVQPTGYGLYGENVYLKGKFVQVNPSGDVTQVTSVRGKWSNTIQYYKYEQVLHNGGVYSALNDNKNSEPGTTNDWEVFIKAEDGKPGIDGQKNPYTNFSYQWSINTWGNIPTGVWENKVPDKINNQNLWERQQYYTVNENNEWILSETSYSIINENIEIGGVNLLSHNPNNWQMGLYLSATGIYSANIRYICSKFTIPISPNSEYVLQRDTDIDNFGYAVLFYDSNDNYLGRSYLEIIFKGGRVFKTPTNATQVKFNYTSNPEATQNWEMLIKNIATDKIALYRGNKIPDWIAHPEDTQVQIDNIVDRNNAAANDNIITIEEKAQLRNDWIELQKTYASLRESAVSIGVSVTAVDAGYAGISEAFGSNWVNIGLAKDYTFPTSGALIKDNYLQRFSNWQVAVQQLSNDIAQKKVNDMEIGGVNYFANSMLEIGGIDAGGGTDVSNASRFRSKGFIEFESAQATIGQFSQHDILIVCYDINKQYITSTFSQAGGWPAKYPFTVKVPIGTKYIRFSCKRSDGATVTQVDLTESKFMVEKGNKPSDYLSSPKDTYSDLASLSYYGLYDNNFTYPLSSSFRSLVKLTTNNNSFYYKTKLLNSPSSIIGEAPVINGSLNSKYWEEFGATYQSIATGLLLAEQANIAGFVFEDNKLYSQNKSLYLDGVNGKINVNLKSGGTTQLDSDGLYLRNNNKYISLSSNESGLIVQPNLSDGTRTQLNLSDGSIKTSANSTDGLETALVIHPASITSYGQPTTRIYNNNVGLTNSTPPLYNMLGAIYNKKENDYGVGVYGTTAFAYDPYLLGGCFDNMMICGLNLKSEIFVSSGTIKFSSTYVSILGGVTTPIVVNLPKTIISGKTLFIRNITRNSGNVKIKCDQSQLIQGANIQTTEVTLSYGYCLLFYYDGGIWYINRLST